MAQTFPGICWQIQHSSQKHWNHNRKTVIIHFFQNFSDSQSSKVYSLESLLTGCLCSDVQITGILKGVKSLLVENSPTSQNNKGTIVLESESCWGSSVRIGQLCWPHWNNSSLQLNNRSACNPACSSEIQVKILSVIRKYNFMRYRPWRKDQFSSYIKFIHAHKNPWMVYSRPQERRENFRMILKQLVRTFNWPRQLRLLILTLLIFSDIVLWCDIMLWKLYEIMLWKI